MNFFVVLIVHGGVVELWWVISQPVPGQFLRMNTRSASTCRVLSISVGAVFYKPSQESKFGITRPGLNQADLISD